MTDRKIIEFWKEKLAEEETPTGTAGLLQRENGKILFQINKLINNYNENEKKIAHCKWHWWYMIKLAERTLKKFKIKSDIYRSKKAKDYWAKRLHKECKIKGKTIEDSGINHIIGFLEAQMLESKYQGAYLTVILEIKERINK